MQKNNLIFIGFLFLVACNNSTINNKTETDIYSKAFIKEKMQLACDWQLENLYTVGVLPDGNTEPVPDNGWVRASFFTGVMATYQITKNQKYLDAAINLGEKNKWKPGPRRRHADDHCIIQTYAQIAMETQKNDILQPSIALFNDIRDTLCLSKDSGWHHHLNWSWCDALYMSPPAMAMVAKATNESSYLTTMDTMWMDTYHFLYDNEEHLFYRDKRYIVGNGQEGIRTKNGKKTFWGRGNGWVLAGIVRILEYLPSDFKNRQTYEQTFKEMAQKIASLQGEDGLWRSSLLDFDEFPAPETSCSGFFCYSLAWGVNNGLLNKDEYLPTIKKAWEGLIGALNDNGKLGYVQLIGHDPRSVTKDDNMEYGTGAFLLAASEMYKLK